MGETRERLVAVCAIIPHADHAAGEIGVAQIQHREIGVGDKDPNPRTLSLDFEMIKGICRKSHRHIGDRIPTVVGVAELKLGIRGVNADIITAVSIGTDVRLADAENQAGIANSSNRHVGLVSKIRERSFHRQCLGAVGRSGHCA